MGHSNPTVKLTEDIVRNFKLSKVFRENSERVNSLTYDSTGELLITSSDDESIVIYDCMNGTPKKTLNSKKYGVDLIRYTHAANTAIHASTKVDDTIRYLSLHDNKYIRYFHGHSRRVTSLTMSPVDDAFISTSMDQSIRLWDLRSPHCQGLMHVSGHSVANFDPEGLIFAAGLSSEKVKLYDLRSFDKGPFSTFKVLGTASGASGGSGDHTSGSITSAGSIISSVSGDTASNEWLDLRFSPDGRMIAISAADEQIYILDAFDGRLIHTFATEATSSLGSNPIGLKSNVPLFNATFSPDSQYVFCGSSDGKVHSWDAQTGSKIGIYMSEHVGTTGCVEFNPKYLMVASACSNTIFWLPRIDD